MKQAIQRTLLLACGRPAEEAVWQLQAQLGAAAPAVAILSCPSDAAGVDDAQLAAALRQISQITVQTELARAGWSLDRLQEIALFLVCEPAMVGPELLSLVDMVAGTAGRLLGVSVAPFCLVLAAQPEEPEVAAGIRYLHSHGRAFIRGITLLGTTTEEGLCLPDEEMLVTTVAQLLHAWIAGPLRDAPEWLAEHSPAVLLLLSAGLVSLTWSPIWEQAQLARGWFQAVLQGWLAGAGERERQREAAEVWLHEHYLEPEQLARAFSELRASWVQHRRKQFPRPWHLPQVLAALQQPAEAVAPEKVQAHKAQLLAAAGAALEKTAVHMVDGQPVGGLATLRLWLAALKRALGERQERLAGRMLIQADRVTALAYQEAELAEEIATELARWPAGHWPAWVRVCCQPWRWLRLAWRYQRLQQLAQQIGQVRTELQQWQWQQQIAATSDECYEALAGLAGRLDCQAEEVEAMLHSLWRELEREQTFWPAWLPEGSGYLAQRLAQLVPDVAQEAVWAARYIGGLGQQLAAADDGFQGPLRAAGQERLASRSPSTLLDALTVLYSEPEARAAWWAEQLQAAVPLWRYNEAEQEEAGRALAGTLTLVCGQVALELQLFLDLPDQPDVRWVASTEPGLTIMRLRAGIPVEGLARPENGGEHVA